MVDRHPDVERPRHGPPRSTTSCAKQLPAAFGDVFLTQKMRPCGSASGTWSPTHGIRPAELVEEKKAAAFGTFCTYVPDEVVIACNGIVTGLCGGSEFWVPEGEKYLQNDVCPLVKASLGARMGRTCPFFRLVDEIVGETTCDGKKKMYEIMATDVPMHIMETPQMKRPKDIDFWASEIADFAQNVQEVTGVELTAENLAHAIDVINARRRALARVYETRKNPDVIPISGTDALLVMQIAFDDPERCTQMANKFACELEERLRDGVSVFPAGTKRILLTQARCWPSPTEAAPHHRHERRGDRLRGELHGHQVLPQPGRRHQNHARGPVSAPWPSAI